MDAAVGEKHRRKILICESYSGLQSAFKLMLDSRYDLIFSNDDEEILPLLDQNPGHLVVWDLDRPTGTMETALDAIRSSDEPLQTYRETICANRFLDRLKAIRRAYPELKILLLAGEFECDFQVAAIQEIGSVSFFLKPWKSNGEIVEKIQVLLGDKKSSIRDWVLRMPLASQETSKRRF